MDEIKLACVSARSDRAIEAKKQLEARYHFVKVEQADVIVALGGDGFILSCLHDFLSLRKPIYGLNRGTIGFLMNQFDLENLPKRVKEARREALHPLSLVAKTENGKKFEKLAFNEVSLIRKSQQAANLSIKIDGKTRLNKLVCDGVIVATAAGSTAYNSSIHGPIIPIGANIIALTPISPFRPRRWRGALLSHHAEIELVNIDPDKRPISATADSVEIENIQSVKITEKKDVWVELLFDQHHSLEERILLEQFA